MIDFNQILQNRRQQGTLRTLTPLTRLRGGRVRLAGESDGPELLDFSSNDYLALSEHPEVIAAGRQALEQLGTGAGAARLMSGDLDLHHRLEEEVAKLKNSEAALLFGSGYLANAGVIPALAGRDDVLFIDRLCHASIYDGCRLARARVIRFRHNDTGHLEELLRRERGRHGQPLIVVESIYSMDGDRAPLADLVALKNRYDCGLMVDEAHATGLFGPRGGGVIEADGVAAEVDVAMGTFGKALGSYGAYVAGSRSLIDYMINRARTFIYATALPPAVVASSLAALRLLRADPGPRRDLWDKVAIFKETLRRGGLTGLGPSQIIPIMVGESRRAREKALALRDRGIFVTAVRPPTVPAGTARLRFSVTRHHDRETLQRVAETVVAVLNEDKR